VTTSARSYPPACVVDASVLIKVFLPEQDADLAIQLVRGTNADSWSRAAPDLIYPECGNTLWKKERQGLLSAARVREIAQDIVVIPLLVWPGRLLLDDATDLALAHGITAYDASYLALSDLLGVPLVTADQRLANRAGGPSDRLILLSSLR
jgi:predicted nucleic acid-binding protein